MFHHEYAGYVTQRNAGFIVHHDALGYMYLPCGKWPLYQGRKNMRYCPECFQKNVLRAHDDGADVRRADENRQALVVPEVSILCVS